MSMQNLLAYIRNSNIPQSIIEKLQDIELLLSFCLSTHCIHRTLKKVQKEKNDSSHTHRRRPSATHLSPIIVLSLLPPLHTHLPRPQRLRQPPRQTRRATTLTIRRRPSIAPPITHTDCAIPRRRRRSRFLSAARPFRWSGGRGFGGFRDGRGEGPGLGGAVDAADAVCCGG